MLTKATEILLRLVKRSYTTLVLCTLAVQYIPNYTDAIHWYVTNCRGVIKFVLQLLLNWRTVALRPHLFDYYQISLMSPSFMKPWKERRRDTRLKPLPTCVYLLIWMAFKVEHFWIENFDYWNLCPFVTTSGNWLSSILKRINLRFYGELNKSFKYTINYSRTFLYIPEYGWTLTPHSSAFSLKASRDLFCANISISSMNSLPP